MAELRPVARPRVLFVGIFAGCFALALLFAVAVIMRWDSGWRFALLVLPVAFAGLTVLEFRRATQRPDEPI